MENSPREIRQLIAKASDGDAMAAEKLFPIVYSELHRLASSYMSRERTDHTLQPTALIHEAFLRLTKSENTNCDREIKAGDEFQSLEHFVGTAAVVMRRILVNHAKAKKTQKRGGGHNRMQLDNVAEVFDRSAIDLIALDEAMSKLAELDETQHRLVELRFFGGMTTKQCAQLLGISERNAFYEWAHAKAWLKREIESE